MFPSVCSLRSAQCAALIALAAAAGISRFEPAESAPVESTNSTPSVTRTTPSRPAHTFRTALLQLFGRVFHCDVLTLSALVGAPSPQELSPSNVVSPNVTPPAARHVESFPPPLTFAPADTRPAFPRPPAFSPLSVRLHVIPFAVGPPAYETAANPPAACTHVLGDSSACRPSVSRIAPLSVRFVVAPSARLRRPALTLAGPLSAPSLTLRGGPSPLRLPSALPGFPSPAANARSTASATARPFPAGALPPASLFS
jgi:hypothetical protein